MAGKGGTAPTRNSLNSLLMLKCVIPLFCSSFEVFQFPHVGGGLLALEEFHVPQRFGTLSTNSSPGVPTISLRLLSCIGFF